MKLNGETKEKERLIREKAELEARLRHEMSEKVKETQEKIESQMRETIIRNQEMTKELEDVRQAHLKDKTAIQRKQTNMEKQI